jgi:phosphonate transport system substrate-binding protein
LKVIWQTSSLPNNGFVARNDIEATIVTKVKSLLLNLHTHSPGRKWLSKMELSKFEKADDNAYDQVREFLTQFNKKVRSIN